MRAYTEKQSIKEEALGEYSDIGFTLEEPDDHIVRLRYKGVNLGTFLQTTVTVAMLRLYCKHYLATLRRADKGA